MNGTADEIRPGSSRRAAALGAIVVTAPLIAWTIVTVASRVVGVLIQLALIPVTMLAIWYALTRIGLRPGDGGRRPARASRPLGEACRS